MSYSILIAESGSTKTEWRLGRGGAVVHAFRSPGANPNVMTKESIEDTLLLAFEGNIKAGEVDEVVFYGAGLGGKSQKEIIREVLGKILPSSKIHVEHDMVAAFRATGRHAGIVCILGTGSNSCMYANDKEVANLGGHGYIFGDEGSGMDIGKNLIKGLLQSDFPEEVRKFVEEKEGEPIYEIKISVHRSEKPNVRMAAFARYAREMIHVQEVKDLVIQRFLGFLDTTVVRYPNYRDQYVDVVGSIGFHFKEQLEIACQMREVKLGKVIQEPVHSLMEYHFKDMA